MTTVLKEGCKKIAQLHAEAHKLGIPPAWLFARSQRREIAGMGEIEALTQAVEDWKEQGRLEQEHERQKQQGEPEVERLRRLNG